MSITCAECSQYIEKVACRDIKPDEPGRFAPHVRSCEACRKKLEDAELFAQAMTRAMHSVSSEPDLVKIKQDLDKVRPTSVHAFRIFWAAAAVVLIGVTTFWLVSQLRTAAPRDVAYEYAELHNTLAQQVVHIKRGTNGIDLIPTPEPDPLPEIQKQIPFQIQLPKHIPEGYKLVKAMHLKSRNGVQLLYANKQQTFSIFELPLTAKDQTYRETKAGENHFIIAPQSSRLVIVMSPSLSPQELQTILHSLTP